VVVQEGSELDLAALRAYCGERLSDYKAPDALVFVDEIPLTPVMKVDARQLALLAEQGAAERRAERVRKQR
jgi:long-chain acyl-CoA synthetase